MASKTGASLTTELRRPAGSVAARFGAGGMTPEAVEREAQRAVRRLK